MSLVPSHVSPITSCTPPDPPLGWGPCSNFTKWRGVPRAQRVGAGSPPCPGCAPPQRRGSREGNKGSGHSWAPAAAAMATPPPATGHGPLGSPSPLPPPPTLASPPSPSPHPPPHSPSIHLSAHRPLSICPMSRCPSSWPGGGGRWVPQCQAEPLLPTPSLPHGTAGRVRMGAPERVLSPSRGS